MMFLFGFGAGVLFGFVLTALIVASDDGEDGMDDGQAYYPEDD